MKWSFIIKLLKSLIPAYAAFYFLIFTPFNIFLDRDLELNGRTVIGNVLESKKNKAKTGYYQTVKVEYLTNDKKYSKWFSDEKLEVGKTTEIIYSPIFPSHSILLKDKPFKLSWNKNLIFRLLIIGFIGLMFGAIAINIIREDKNE